jgi:colicin import membrane protein
MKLTHLVLASAFALVPVTAALADDDKKAALKKAKEAAKQKAIDAAKEKSEAKRETAGAKVEKKIEAKKDAAAAVAAASEEEKQTHAKHLGMIDRLTQIATATNNTDLTATIARLTEKEAKRHALASGEG